MLANTLGVGGDILVIIAFFLLQTNRVKSSDLSYLLLNIIGSLGVLFSLMYYWNLPSFIIETSWVAISCWSLYNYLKKRAVSS
ncbi:MULTISPECIES: CBU_0592 family membrane protein [Francisella]|uniref:CBU-0592-like domain-containing protein n=4 Tax=Francisella TaxID=262 RepID=A0AAJ4TKZ4_9GAMM|nr:MULTISPECIES: hypothetical protein [Francisella]AEI35436.1 hypothetical protein F7308_0508 [Francisella salina]QEO57786.1 hypothetical protein F0R74_07925 [Francisella marina]QEO59988.1 hypothetical protein F0R75_09390 [Francisella marina]QWU99207.1 hypothetical protein KQR59_08920 [Francisella salimarina]